MAAVFESILRMSAVGSIVIIAVLIVRLCLKKAPKFYSYLLWAIVLLRLVCPFTVESAVSLIPDKLSSETAAGELSSDYIWPSTKLYSDESGFETAVDAGAEVYYTDTGDSYVNVSIGAPIPSPSSGLDLMTALAIIWLCGVAAMALWSIAGYIRLKHRLRGAMVCDNGVYLSYKVDTPFVLGFFLPKIYLPGDISAEEWEYIVMHERCHIRRGDHVTRVAAFAALAVHWFNPLVWLAFILSGRDMEMSCDEAVIRALGPEVRGDYSASLLSLATGRPMLSAMPLAFGEGDPKGRIRNLAKWKKPTVWIVIAALLICAAAAVCLLTDPLEREAQIRVNGRVYTYVGSEEMPIGQVWELGMLEGIVHRSGEEPDKDFYGTNLDEKYAGQPLYAGLDGRIYLFDEDGFFLPFELPKGEVVSGSINRETELGLSGLLTEIEPGDIADDGHYYRNDFQPETLAEAMNALGEPTDAVFSGEIADWSYSFSIDGETDGAKKLYLMCGLAENLVQIVLKIGDKQETAVYKDKALYTLLRHSRDVESSIDPYISRDVNAAAEALMQKGLEEYAGNPAQFVDAELTVLSPHSGYVRDDGSEVELYDFAYALIPSKPENLIIAGGAVMDGDLRVHGTGVSYMAVEYRGGRVVKFAPLWGGYFFTEGGLDAEDKEIIENALGSGFDVTLQDPIIDDGSSYPLAIPYGVSVVTDLDGDGVTETVCQKVNDGGYRIGSITVNGVEYLDKVLELCLPYPNNAEARSIPCWYLTDILSGDGKKEMTFYDGGPSADPVTFFFDYDKGELKYLGNIPYYSDSIKYSGDGYFTAPAKLYIFQTWFAEHTWSIFGPDGTVQNEPRDFYYVDFRFRDYTVGDEYFPGSDTSPLLRDVKVYAEMDVNSELRLYATGMEISILGTDNKEWLLISDGSREYYLHIDGASIEVPGGSYVEAQKVLNGLHYYG